MWRIVVTGWIIVSLPAALLLGVVCSGGDVDDDLLSDDR